MLYTGKGDKGETGLFGCDQKIAKSSTLAEALGAVDEINSLLGLCKLKSAAGTAKILATAQQTLFIIQAELAGAKKTVGEAKLRELETAIGQIGRELPPITSFFVSGGTELAALLDFARTVARRAERGVVAVLPERKIGRWSLAYLNRLSSLLYVLARLANHKDGIKEERPHYQ